MIETEGKTISEENIDTRELYGAKNVYLEQIKALHPKLKIIARGHTLKVLGAKGDIERFERRMQSLIDYYDRYGHISKEVVDQSFAAGFTTGDAPQEGSSAAPRDSEVIVYGNNGVVVKARTENQRKLVNIYDKCDLIFATGPAGTGKTYISSCIANRALERGFTGYYQSAFKLLDVLEKLKFGRYEDDERVQAEYVEKYIPEKCIERLFLNFSCPFPKNAYAVHRLTHHRFLKIYKNILKKPAQHQRR